MKWRGWTAAVLLQTATASVGGAAPPDATRARYDIVYSTEVATPHVAWAPRLPGGPLKGFFIPSVSEGRDMAELMQRLALEATTVTIDRQWDVNCWGIGDYYGHEYRGDRDDFETVYRYVEEELTGPKPFEVLLIPGLNGWSRLTRASRDAILRRVKDGAGLVLLHPFVGDVKGHPFKGDERERDERLSELSPLAGVPDDFVSERGYPELNTEAITQARWTPRVRHFITEGVPLELIPSGRVGGRFYNYESRGDVLIEAGGRPVLAVKAYGKGRVVAFAYVQDGFLPEAVDPIESHVYWDYWEYQYSLLLRSLLWAAGRDSGVAMERPVLTGTATSLRLPLRSDRKREVEVEIKARSEFGPAAPTLREGRSLPAGPTTLTVPAERVAPPGGFAGGRQIVDVIVHDAASGVTLDWATATFEVAKRATVTGVKPNASVYRVGDTLSVVTRAAGRLDGLQMRLELRDDLGRLLWREDRPTSGEKTFFPRLEGFLGKRGFLSASLVEGERIVDQLRAEPVVVVQRERRSREYRALLSFENPRPSLAPLRQQRLRSLGMDSGFTWGGKVNDGLEVPRGWFGVYWYDRGPTTPQGLEQAIREYEATGDFASLQYLTKKELYKRTGDSRFLVRSPSLDDPAVLRTLADVAGTAARNKAVYNMDYYFVGDEGSLTSYADPVDFCFGPYTLANFRLWLKAQYGSLEALNRTWSSAFPNWEAVRPMTTEEARKSGVFPPWADHRTYMEVSFANAYQVVRDAVVKGDPEGRIALSGTQVTTPWNGADWARLDRVIDDFLSYDGGNQWDLHRSFAKPGARVGFWTGYGRSGAGVRHEIWSAALQGVLFPNLFWSYSVFNPDLTWSRSGRDMGSVFQALRFEGIGKLLMESERVSDGIAVHYSMPSVHAAGILGFHDRGKADDDDDPGFPANRDGWVRGLTDLGLSFDFVSSEQIEDGALDPARFKVVVLPLSLALSDKEARAIEAFAHAGGTVIADGAAGLFDEHCAWRTRGALDGLLGISAPSPEKRSLTQSRARGAVSGRPSAKDWGLEAAGLGEVEALEPGLQAKDSEALLRIGGEPAVFVRPLGKGFAIDLNLLLDRYPPLRKKPFGGGSYRALLSALLGRVGIRPAIALDGGGRDPGPTRIVRHRFGGSEVIGVLTEPIDVAEAYGRDGVRVYDDSKLGKVVTQDLEIRLSGTAHVVNVRNGEYLGHTDRVRARVTAGDALILAASPERATLKVRGPSEVQRGGHPTFALEPSGTGRHLVRCHVFGPDGAFLPVYAGNVMVEGAGGTFVLPTALDDPPGSWRISATDLLSGASATAEMELR